MYLVNFLLLSGTSSILRTFLGGTSSKSHPVVHDTIVAHLLIERSSKDIELCSKHHSKKSTAYYDCQAL